MASNLLRLLFFLAMLGVAGTVSGLVMRYAFPDAWIKRLRRAWLVAAAVAAVALVAWMAGRAAHVDVLVRTAAPVVAVVLMAMCALFVTSPAWGSLSFLARAVEKRAPDPRRRQFLGRALGVLPAGAALTGPTGALSARRAPVLRELDVVVAALPAALDGLRILQISDVHLGPFIDVAQVESVVEAARDKKPHLVALTGDIADDYELLPPAMAAVKSLEAPLGMFAIIGNHEVYRGRDEAIRLFKAGGATFLCDDGAVVEHNGARFFIAGTDDPTRLGGTHAEFFTERVPRALSTCPDDVATKILLAHRPDAFDAAAVHGVSLQLSGHTHGAQMALFGRSLLEGIVPLPYILGRYSVGKSELYTTAGLGHWFPFRLNCPAEAALITLRRA